MDCDLGVIDLIHIHAIEETIRFVDQKGPDATYEDLIKHLSWYWMDHSNKMSHRPQGWVLEWIKCFVGNSNEDRCFDSNNF